MTKSGRVGLVWIHKNARGHVQFNGSSRKMEKIVNARVKSANQSEAEMDDHDQVTEMTALARRLAHIAIGNFIFTY